MRCNEPVKSVVFAIVASCALGCCWGAGYRRVFSFPGANCEVALISGKAIERRDTNSMKEEDYTERHTHPMDSTVVEIVAYERRDQSWDVFIYEPAGTVPEMESQRTDESHIFVENIKTPDELDKVAKKIESQLGAGYERVPFYREAGTRRVIGKIYDHLRKQGAQNMWVHSNGLEDWELLIRRKDVTLAEQVTLSNVSR